jgi:acid stress chaperone HdeB
MLLLAWLNGYSREESDPPVVNTEEFADEARKLRAYCVAHPQTTMSTAADEIFAD